MVPFFLVSSLLAVALCLRHSSSVTFRKTTSRHSSDANSRRITENYSRVEFRATRAMHFARSIDIATLSCTRRNAVTGFFFFFFFRRVLERRTTSIFDRFGPVRRTSFRSVGSRKICVDRDRFLSFLYDTNDKETFFPEEL